MALAVAKQTKVDACVDKMPTVAAVARRPDAIQAVKGRPINTQRPKERECLLPTPCCVADYGFSIMHTGGASDGDAYQHHLCHHKIHREEWALGRTRVET